MLDRVVIYGLGLHLGSNGWVEVAAGDRPLLEESLAFFSRAAGDFKVGFGLINLEPGSLDFFGNCGLHCRGVGSLCTLRCPLLSRALPWGRRSSRERSSWPLWTCAPRCTKNSSPAR